ncbi:p21-C-terminal region-binding protein-domain-containing protein [Papiliotrema laurentii]|uniref:Protein BCP1 n=1 Tax=Papiliotrema laurentii TaxID=5418 RepID=A0AAD9FRU9_PAPLA|nr:p21-C-terminal region-binding protein-domain-containing protein [Papiliotrema laurentii]
MPSTNPQLSAVPASAAASKRKDAPREDEEDDDSGSEAGSDVSMINVDFDFYNLNPDVDQIAVKRLLRQHLSHDDELIDVHPLAELILSEGVRLGSGSSVKTDGEESDPWALVAAVDIIENRENPAFKPFLDYLISTTTPNSPLRAILQPSSTTTQTIRPALVFSLRMLNLPLPLIPPLYKMLMSELKDSVEAPNFTHWLIWGRGYKLEGSEEGMGLDLNPVARGSKKAKNGGQTVSMTTGTFPYHPEEEFIDKVAKHVHTYPFKSAPKRDEESFGVEQHGRIILAETAQLASAIASMEAAC